VNSFGDNSVPQVQRIAGQVLDVASQIVATQPTLDDDIVEALHHRRLVEHRQPTQFDWAIDTSDAFAVIR